MKTDYRIYKLSILELTEGLFIYFVAAAGISYLFYNSFIPVLFMIPLSVYAMKMFKTSKCEKRKKKLYEEFKDMVQSLSSGLEAGYSFEKAFDGAYEEMVRLHGADSCISLELKGIIKGIKLNENVENLLVDFGERSGVQDISDFSQIISVAKRTGGNMIKIMKRTSENICRKLEVENEIDTLVTSKKFEQRIMTAMPFLIICYLRIANDGYIDILYQNMGGKIIMTICLAVCAFSFVWGRKIINIGV